jgi:S-DNA-T family DNA segregation ATPase FtsK/SpoIIIE
VTVGAIWNLQQLAKRALVKGAHFSETSGGQTNPTELVATLICRMTPEELRLLIVDPKQVEFAAYSDIPHLFEENGEALQIATDPEEARYLLDVAVREMDRRYGLLCERRVKKLEDYNRVAEEKLPYVVFIVDEFADLMLMGTKLQAKEVENKIVRIAQKARAVGIHMILATQKPLATIMTTLIKANMPARAAFSVISGMDSRVILDENGAETLCGNGDMLYRDPLERSEYARIKRIQVPWLSDTDTETLINQGSN